MKKLMLVGFLFGAFQLNGQSIGGQIRTPMVISFADSIMWANTPRLQLNTSLLPKLILPEHLDNSTKIYFPKITVQAAANCGQASGVRNAYTYELNRLLTRSSKQNTTILSSMFNIITTAHGSAEITLKTWENMKSIGTLYESDLSDREGCSYIDIKPNVDYLQWDSYYLNGYHWYYTAMQNKVSDYASILMDSEEGILTMKNWLHNHLEGDSVGGVGIVYLSLENYSEISSGYDSGKVILPFLGSPVNHSMTIVGYDDRIEYDANHDGQITTEIDINNDGIVDVRDWEKGAVILANSYGTDYWGNNGYVYLLYRNLALSPTEGGIWNRSMYVVKPKLPTKPKVTYRFTMEHQNKSKIIVTAGISANPNGSTPEYSIEIPFLKYIAKPSSISCDTNGISTPVEFGFDVTPLLNHIAPEANARFFLQVYEVDSENRYSGSIKRFSVIDYTHGAKEIIANSAPVSIQNNEITTLYVNVAPEFSKPQITDNLPPKVIAGEPYSCQLTATQGTPPYRFKKCEGYSTSESNLTQPILNGQTPLPVPMGSNASIAIDCQFPVLIYDSIHTGKVYINPHGYIQLHNYEYEWPFNQVDYTQINGHTTIAPLMSYLAFDKPEFGVWYNSTPDSLYVNWRGRFVDDPNSKLSFSATIFKNGTIQFQYDTIQYTVFNPWKRGVSRGNGIDMTKIGNEFTIETHKKFQLIKETPDTSIHVSSDGLISIESPLLFDAKVVPISVLDNNDLESNGTVKLSQTEGSDIKLISYELNNHQLWFSHTDTIHASITLKNQSNQRKQNIILKIAKNRFDIDFIKNEISISELLPNETITISNAFIFKSNTFIETDRIEYIDVTSDVNEKIGAIKVNLTTHIPLEVGPLIIDSINALGLIPNSNQTIQIPVKNRNRFPIYHLKTILTSSSSDLIVQNETTLMDSIEAFATDTIRVNISTQNLNSPDLRITLLGKLLAANEPEIPFAHTFYLNANSIENYENEQNPFIFNSLLSDTLPLKVVNSGCNSTKSWFYNRTSTTTPHSTTRTIHFYNVANAYIEFDYRIQSTLLPNVKRLQYLLDQTMYSLELSSTWKHIKIPVSEGAHDFSLIFSAPLWNDSIFIDNLSIPIFPEPNQCYQINPSEIKLKCKPDTTILFTIETESIDNSITTLNYNVIPYQFQKTDWLGECGIVVLPQNQTQNTSYQANTSGLASGNYTAYLQFYDSHFYTPVKVSLEVIDGYHTPSAGSILVYPNPASDKITFDVVNDSETSASLTIYDMLGRKAFYQEQNIDFGTSLKTITFTISWKSEGNSTKGLYLYQLKVGNDIYCGKITIIH